MKIKKSLFILALMLGLGQFLNGQVIMNSDSIYKERTPMSGRLWGVAFGDYYFKGHSDSLNRGGVNQYTGLDKNDNAFALRRAYLAYDFNISKRFSTHMILASENWNQTTKFSPYLKIMNIQWHNIWKGTDLIVGLQPTPAFIESSTAWGYRSIERTLVDIRRTSSIDLGIALKGTFDASKNYGYHILIGNGSGAKAENNRFKNVYGNVYGKFFDKNFTINLYADYERLDWKPGFHHSESMAKVFLGYTGTKLTAGVEGFLRYGKSDLIANSLGSIDTISMNSIGLSVFVRGIIVPDKLNFFARMDMFNPYLKFDDNLSYSGLSARYNPNVKEYFATLGLDYTPVKGVHFMPNVWFNSYQSQYNGATGAAKNDYDLVYRMTFYYTFGKN